MFGDFYVFGILRVRFDLTRVSVRQMFDVRCSVFERQVGWLAGWLLCSIFGRLVGWLAGWLFGWLAGWVVGWYLIEILIFQ